MPWHPAHDQTRQQPRYLPLLQYVRPYWKAIALALCATAVMAATEPMFPALFKSLLDEGFAKAGGQSENP